MVKSQSQTRYGIVKVAMVNQSIEAFQKHLQSLAAMAGQAVVKQGWLFGDHTILLEGYSKPFGPFFWTNYIGIPGSYFQFNQEIPDWNTLKPYGKKILGQLDQFRFEKVLQKPGEKCALLSFGRDTLDGKESLHLLLSGHRTQAHLALLDQNQHLLQLWGSQLATLIKGGIHPLATSDLVSVPPAPNILAEPFATADLLEDIAKPYLILLKRLIHRREERLFKLEKDASGHEENLQFQKVAEHLMALNEPRMEISSIGLDGIAYPIDPKLSSGKNAERYFKRFKKAKSGIVQSRLQKTKALDELTDLKARAERDAIRTLAQLEALKDFLIAQRLLGQTTAKKPEPIKAENPYFVERDGLRISFGTNRQQNDHLTFTIAKKKDWIFHIHNQSGAHVILHHANPSKEHIAWGAMIALSLAKKLDGEVSYTQLTHVRKTKQLGLVKLEQYASIRIKHIETWVDALLKTAKRY